LCRRIWEPLKLNVVPETSHSERLPVGHSGDCVIIGAAYAARASPSATVRAE
jgi:hypothetical protein